MVTAPGPWKRPAVAAWVAETSVHGTLAEHALVAVACGPTVTVWKEVETNDYTRSAGIGAPGIVPPMGCTAGADTDPA